MKAIDKIHQKHQTITNYPQDVVPVNGRIKGTAFFPGGDGLWKEHQQNDELTIGGIMIVGHNFDNVTGFQKSLQQGTEPINCPTWRNIVALLTAAKVPLEDCFFTNVYVGLMQSASNVGVFPGSKSAEFKQQCLEFLQYQISIQQPRVVLTLGGFVPALISRLSTDLSDWAAVDKITQLDLKQRQLVQGVRFCHGAVTSTVVALTHPAQRHLNVARRSFNGIAGHEAELEMLRVAMEK